MQSVAMEHGDIETARAQAVTSEVSAALEEKTTVTPARRGNEIRRVYIENVEGVRDDEKR